ncbi:MAG: putative DNA binding domain-containing protein [Ardenticatenaceae bacterium]|nr:putative DNA binding domain-containing protein [Ardenticatenaceae bacterium]MCB8947395.1 putative DNA binding domain-containing protein [Ardenticatenaceae bacterium]
MDLHLHTPGSGDYQESNVSYLDILRQAEIRGLDIIAFTDHNSVAGFAAMRKEVERLLWLEELGRFDPEEKRRLDEYRRLLDKILVLPGFEFTATFGFHILGIFPQDTPISFLEHLLLTLRVPLDSLRQGSATVGATADVLTAYRVISEAGGLVIAAHANSSNGVAMRGLDFGGQTRIAYTQDPNLHVLEVTDLEKRGRYTTRRFFDGSKPEYPRAMRCIQGSDAHRLTRESANAKQLGIGDRITEVLLPEVSFEALSTVLKGNDLSLTRPYRGPANPIDFVQVAREEGESIVQAFHAAMTQRGGHQNQVLRDVCAMANGNGGTIYIGASANPKEKPVGVRDHSRAIDRLQTVISNKLTPEPNIHIDSLPSQGVQIVRITVQPGPDKPYAIDDNQFYIRDDTETSLAVRDEIVRLIKTNAETAESDPEVLPPLPPIGQLPPQISASATKVVEPPRTGVEIVESEKRKGTYYHTVRDLRNGNLIKNVTRSSARKLWHYAITKVENGTLKPSEIAWQGNIAVLDVRKKDDNVWYDLAMRENDTIHYFYGVTDSGLNDNWLALIEKAQ